MVKEMISVNVLKPKAALNYWSSKVPVTKKDFDKLSDEAKRRAFTVSGLSRLDQVTAVQTAITKCLDDGGTLADFKKQIPDIIKAQGWTGKSAHRIDNIFRTNLQSAYMAGRYEQMSKTTKLRPYWMLVAVHDKRTRTTHIAVDGLIFPHDHPFWNTWFPPNGFACRCTVITLSERQVKARGLKVETDMPDRLLVVDPATGMETFVTPIPDKGWSQNVGKDWLAGLEPSEVDGQVKTLGDKAICRGGQFAKDDPCKPPLKDIDHKHLLSASGKDILPKGLKDEEYVKAFLKEFGLKGLNCSKVISLPGTKVPIVINKGFFIDKRTGLWKVQNSEREQFVKLLARTIQNPFEIWSVPVEISGKKLPALRFIRLFKDKTGKKIGGFVAFNLINGRRWQAATAFTPKVNNEVNMLKYLERQRAGILIYREP